MIGMYTSTILLGSAELLIQFGIALTNHSREPPRQSGTQRGVVQHPNSSASGTKQARVELENR